MMSGEEISRQPSLLQGRPADCPVTASGHHTLSSPNLTPFPKIPTQFSPANIYNHP